MSGSTGLVDSASACGKSRAAIILGGGRSRRMGQDKLALRVGDQTILQRVVEAASAWADRIVVAGPDDEGRTDAADAVTFIQENPPFGGPAAGIGAAVGELADLPDSGEVLILAGDLARPEQAVAALTRNVPAELAARQPATDGLVLVEDGGWPQLLVGRYRVGALRKAVAAAPYLANMSVRRLMRPLGLQTLSVKDAVTRDVDTPSDYQKVFGQLPSSS